MNQRLCPRCGTPIQPGGTVCERCEQPVDGPAAVRYNPAGLALPSPVQGHATVMAGILVAMALLFFGAWYLLHGVGPFQTTVVQRSVLPDRSAAVVEVLVTNQGSRPGQARCQASGAGTNGELRASPVSLSPRIAAGATASVGLRIDGLDRVTTLDVTCR